jgi:hypothetical protein
MSVFSSVPSIPVIMLIKTATSLDAGLWIGAALLTVLAFSAAAARSA